jgi:hypothetical protein
MKIGKRKRRETPGSQTGDISLILILILLLLLLF